jgi:single-strand selective monofunctional uracil DNA glycosylase
MLGNDECDKKFQSVEQLLETSRDLAAKTAVLSFSKPVHTVYRPLEYAWALHEEYIIRSGRGPKRVIFLGMNPGPWGMAQTGVPFGEIEAVKSWMGLSAGVTKPAQEHPKRPIQGLDCTRSEVSGRRLWGLMQTRFGSPESFFQDHFVANYCPLVFMEESGRNYTPDKLAAAEKEALFAACDRRLRQVIDILKPEWVIGLGKFAQVRIKIILDEMSGTALAEIPKCDWVLHPSPASPMANRGWSDAATDKLVKIGVWREE